MVIAWLQNVDRHSNTLWDSMLMLTNNMALGKEAGRTAQQPMPFPGRWNVHSLIPDTNVSGSQSSDTVLLAL